MWTLGRMLDEVRLEIGQSSAVASQQRDARERQVAAINSAQDQLWYDYEWPHLRSWADKPLKVGQRYYDFPTLSSGREGDPPQQIEHLQVKRAVLRWDDRWNDLTRGIDPLLYDIYDSDDADKCQKERVDPPSHWDVYGERQFQVWPVPNEKCRLIRFISLKPVRQLINDEDVPSLDGRLVVLFAAVKLATEERLRARIQAEATRQYTTLRARGSNTQGWSALGGGLQDYRWSARDYVASYRPPRPRG